MRKLWFYPQAVLQGEENTMIRHPGRQEVVQQIVLCCFKSDQHHVAYRNCDWSGVSMNIRQTEITVFGIDFQPMALHMGVVLVQQEVNLQPGALELGPVKATDGPRSDNGIAHVLPRHWGQSITRDLTQYGAVAAGIPAGRSSSAPSVPAPLGAWVCCNAGR